MLQNLLDPRCEKSLQESDLKVVLRVVKTVLWQFHSQLKNKCGVFLEALLGGECTSQDLGMHETCPRPLPHSPYTSFCTLVNEKLRGSSTTASTALAIRHLLGMPHLHASVPFMLFFPCLRQIDSSCHQAQGASDLIDGFFWSYSSHQILDADSERSRVAG